MLVFQPVGIELYAVVLAILRLGAVPMFVDVSAGRSVIGAACEAVAPDGFIGTALSHLLRLAVPRLRRVPLSVSTDYWLPGAVRARGADDMAPRREICPRSASDRALITFTSGSTGRPKGVSRSHGFLLAQDKAVTAVTRPRLGEVELNSLPVFVFVNLGIGVTSVIPAGGEIRPLDIDPGAVLRQIQTYGVERVIVPPAFVAASSARRGTPGRTCQD